MRQVYRVTDGGVIEQLARANISDHGIPGGNANAEAQVVVRFGQLPGCLERPLLDRQGGPHSPQGVIRLRVRRIPYRQYRVPHEFIQRPFFFQDGIRSQRKIVIQHLEQHFRLGGFAKRGETAEIREKDGDLLAETIEAQMTRIGEQAITHARGHHPPKCLADMLLFGLQTVALGQVFKNEGSAFGPQVGVIKRRAGEAQVQGSQFWKGGGDFPARGAETVFQDGRCGGFQVGDERQGAAQ